MGESRKWETAICRPGKPCGAALAWSSIRFGRTDLTARTGDAGQIGRNTSEPGRPIDA